MNNLTIPETSSIQTGNGNIESLIPTNIIETNNQTQGAIKTMTTTNGNSKFSDLFWFVNPKTHTGESLDDGEAGLVILSLNMNFGNIRISMYPDVKDQLRGSSLFLDHKKLLTHATIYPASMFEVLSYYTSKNTKELPITCIEQLINPYTDQKWQNELSTCTIVTSPFTKFKMIIKDTYKDEEPETHYEFKGVQATMLQHTLSKVLDNQLITGLAKNL